MRPRVLMGDMNRLQIPEEYRAEQEAARPVEPASREDAAYYLDRIARGLGVQNLPRLLPEAGRAACQDCDRIADLRGYRRLALCDGCALSRLRMAALFAPDVFRELVGEPAERDA